jgi:hypothetical protein
VEIRLSVGTREYLQEQFDMLQGLSSTNLLKRLPSYMVAFQQPPARKIMKATPELDRSIDRLIDCSDSLIARSVGWLVD